jgi:hypothetical protein
MKYLTFTFEGGINKPWMTAGEPLAYVYGTRAEAEDVIVRLRAAGFTHDLEPKEIAPGHVVLVEAGPAGVDDDQ